MNVTQPECNETNYEPATNTTIFEIVEEINNQQNLSEDDPGTHQKIVKTTIFSEEAASGQDEPDFILSQTLVNTVIVTSNGHSNGNHNQGI